MQLGRIKGLHRFGDAQQAGIAHFQDVSHGHGLYRIFSPGKKTCQGQ
jgi:hypothetical protein